MTVDKFNDKSRQTYETIVNKARIGDESALQEIEALAIRAFNEGIVSQMQASSKKFKSTGEMNSYLPDFFSSKESATANEMVKLVISNIRAQTTNSFLNAGFMVPIEGVVRRMIQTVYMIGLNAGFEIASNDSLKQMYLADKERFIDAK